MYMVGAARGPTVGAYSGYWLFCGGSRRGEADRGSHENMSMTSQDDDYPSNLGMTMPGDSGSIMWNGDGVAIGLLTRGLSPQYAKSTSTEWTMVPSIEDVLSDIKRVTGAKDVRVLRRG